MNRQNIGGLARGVMKSDTSITSDVYWKQLYDMVRKFAVKQSRLTNRSASILLLDNARPHSAKVTVAKLSSPIIRQTLHSLINQFLRG